MIDLTTGIMEFDGIIIRPDCSLKDFEKYDADKVHIMVIEDGGGVVTLNHLVRSNGIEAGIDIYINEKMNLREVEIMPSLGEDTTMGLLDASKQWLHGMAKGSYKEKEGSIIGSYEWGYMVAQYRDDRDYGTVGGEIGISYGKW